MEYYYNLIININIIITLIINLVIMPYLQYIIEKNKFISQIIRV